MAIPAAFAFQIPITVQAQKIREKTIQSIQIQTFMEKFLELDGEQNIFDEQLWTEIVDRVTVYSKEKVTFTFIGGIEVTVEL